MDNSAIINEVANNLGMGYMYDDWSRVNYRADKKGVHYPLLIDLLPVSGTITIGSGQVYDSPNSLFAFVDKAELDFDGRDNSGVVERMKRLAMRFIRDLNATGKFEPIYGDLHYQTLYDKLDVNVTGICIELPLKDAVGICEDDV